MQTDILRDTLADKLEQLDGLISQLSTKTGNLKMLSKSPIVTTGYLQSVNSYLDDTLAVMQSTLKPVRSALQSQPSE